jgi:rfaE bifunctional protein kinase chain/domain
MHMSNVRTVFVSGHFNVLHPGHLRLLRFAKECGDYLIVAIESDHIAGSAAYVPENLRLEGVQCNNWVNECFIFDTSIEEVIGRIKPDVVVKGKEHELLVNIEEEAVSSYGGRILFSSGEAKFSSLDMLRKEVYGLNAGMISIPREYLFRHNIKIENLISLVNKFNKLKVCVIGDMIVDEYITCQSLGMSQEEPTIVVTPVDSTTFIGGSGIVASHSAGLGAETKLVSVIGDDISGEFATKSTYDNGVDTYLFKDDSRPTTLKKRYRSHGKGLLRVNFMHKDSISKEIQKQIFNRIKLFIKDMDLLIFSDFNYGCLPQDLVEKITVLAKSNSVLLAADSQSSSQVGDVGRFKGMCLITPTELEARISMKDHESGLVVLADKLQKQSQSENVFLKIGEEGLLINATSNNTVDWHTDKINALNSIARDVAGAGDSMLVTSAMALSAGGNIWEAAFLGSLAAAVQVGRVGNVPMNSSDLIQELK